MKCQQCGQHQKSSRQILTPTVSVKIFHQSTRAFDMRMWYRFSSFHFGRRSIRFTYSTAPTFHQLKKKETGKKTWTLAHNANSKNLVSEKSKF